MKRKIIIKRGRGNYADQFYAVIIADNGQPLAHTEHRVSKSRLKRVIEKYFPDFEIVEE